MSKLNTAVFAGWKLLASTILTLAAINIALLLAWSGAAIYHKILSLF